MAKIVTESIVITFSKIVKDTDSSTSITSPDIQAALEQVAQELIGDNVVVEVVKA
jgi:signal recognition particle GTPase